MMPPVIAIVAEKYFLFFKTRVSVRKNTARIMQMTMKATVLRIRFEKAAIKYNIVRTEKKAIEIATISANAFMPSRPSRKPVNMNTLAIICGYQ